MSSAPDPLNIFFMSLRHEGSNRVVLPDEAENPVSGEWIRTQMNEEVESALNDELLTKVQSNPSVSMYEDELIRRTQPRGGLLGDDRLYQAFQDWRQAALMKLWQVLRLENSRPTNPLMANMQSQLAQCQQISASSDWLKHVVNPPDPMTASNWILTSYGPYTSFFTPTLPNVETKLATDSLRTWLAFRIGSNGSSRGWRKELVETFPIDAWRNAVMAERGYHRTYLASLLYELAWPEREDPPATQLELVRLLTEGPLQAEIRQGEFGESVDESWMQIVDYAVVDLPTGQLVRVLRPGLFVAGRVVRKAHVVISR